MRRILDWSDVCSGLECRKSGPAARVKLQNRGLLRAGYIADIVVFDPTRVQSLSTYETPEASPLGIVTVIKDGKVVRPGNLN